MKHLVERTLAQQAEITEAELADRKAMLGLTEADGKVLQAHHDLAEMVVDPVVKEFYAQQIEVPAFARVYGDRDTLIRLKHHMAEYILSMFGGVFGMAYVNSRLKIGQTHARIGVAPKHYCSSLYRLEQVLVSHLSAVSDDPALFTALSKVLNFDLQLVIDSYVQALRAETAPAPDPQETPSPEQNWSDAAEPDVHPAATPFPSPKALSKASRPHSVSKPQGEDDHAAIITRTLHVLRGGLKPTAEAS